MDFLGLIQSRRSVRAFGSRDIEKQKIDMLLEAAKWAPSAGNMQARDFILVREKNIKEKIAAAALNQDFISEAPLVVVACANKKKSSMRYGPRGESLYSIQDATIAVQNMLLMAHSIGLGSCWVGAFNEEQVKEILKIPEGIKPIAIVPIGYPAEKPPPPDRRIDVHEERW